MTDLNSILENDTGGITYYDGAADVPRVPMPEGVYPAHITEVRTATRTVKSQYKALIYNVKVTIDKDAKSRSYEGTNAEGNAVTVTGEQYIGNEYSSKGVFKFLHPNGDAEFEANPGGNKGYFAFCKAVGKEPKDTEVEIDGEKITVKELPDLTEDDIMGKPVLVTMGKGKPWVSDRDGKTRVPIVAKWFNFWSEGTTLTEDELNAKALEDLPF